MNLKLSIALSICFVTAVIALLFGGANSLGDPELLRAIIVYAQGHPQFARGLGLVTHVGSAPALLGLTVLTCTLLLWKGKPSHAIFLAVAVIAGRMSVDFLKILVERPRPEMVPFPVPVTSFSFPSGHAANSMITFLTIALVAAPPARRQVAVAGAILASLAIGITRPLLGVHWPSDVLAGWAHGLLWVLFCWTLVMRVEKAA